MCQFTYKWFLHDLGRSSLCFCFMNESHSIFTSIYYILAMHSVWMSMCNIHKLNMWVFHRNSLKEDVCVCLCVCMCVCVKKGNGKRKENSCRPIKAAVCHYLINLILLTRTHTHTAHPVVFLSVDSTKQKFKKIFKKKSTLKCICQVPRNLRFVFYYYL